MDYDKSAEWPVTKMPAAAAITVILVFAKSVLRGTGNIIEMSFYQFRTSPSAPEPDQDAQTAKKENFTSATSRATEEEITVR